MIQNDVCAHICRIWYDNHAQNQVRESVGRGRDSLGRGQQDETWYNPPKFLCPFGLCPAISLPGWSGTTRGGHQLSQIHSWSDAGVQVLGRLADVQGGSDTPSSVACVSVLNHEQRCRPNLRTHTSLLQHRECSQPDGRCRAAGGDKVCMMHS